MNLKKYFTLSLIILAAFSCVTGEKGKKMEVLPYFNLSGFIDVEIAKIDGLTVTKVSRINGEEKIVDVVYSAEDWKEEFLAFYRADINTPSLSQAYSTVTRFEYLIHELLPEAKGKVKEIKIRYVGDYPSSITFRTTEENLFFSTSTIGEFHMNLATNKLDHYSIETTQKVWFLKPTNIKVSGIIK
jgi:predicted RNA-binding protein with EMAP domain